VAVHAQARNHVAQRILVHPFRGRRRGFFAVIQRGGGSACRPVHHKPAPADVAGHREGDSQRKLHGHGGVHGIASPFQNVHSHPRSIGVGRYHHAVPDSHPFGRLGQDKRCGRQEGEQEEQPGKGVFHG
jgi:hypothetical protein